MLTFSTFRGGLGGKFVREHFKLDISRCPNWKSFNRIMLANRDRFGGAGGFWDNITKKYAVLSTGEKAVMLAILWVIDYTALADELTQGRASFLGLAEYTTGAHKNAVLACLALANDDKDV